MVNLDTDTQDKKICIISVAVTYYKLRLEMQKAIYELVTHHDDIPLAYCSYVGNSDFLEF